MVKKQPSIRIIAGNVKGLQLDIPPQTITRPTMDRVRENVFNILQSNLGKWGGPAAPQSVIDGFCGSGAYGIESYSRWRSKVLFIEKDGIAFSILKKNTARATRAFPHEKNFLNCKQLDFLQLNEQNDYFHADLIFLDPPYDFTNHTQLLNLLATEKWSHKDTVWILETAKTTQLALPETFTILAQKTYGKALITILQKIHTDHNNRT